MKRQLCYETNAGFKLSFFFLLTCSQAKKRSMFLPSDKTPQRLMSHRAYLSSILKRDALGFIPREKQAGSPGGPTIALSLELCKKKNEESCARYVNWFTYISSAHGACLQVAKDKRQVGMSYACATIHVSLHFDLGLTMYFLVTELRRIFISASTLRAKAQICYRCHGRKISLVVRESVKYSAAQFVSVNMSGLDAAELPKRFKLLQMKIRVTVCNPSKETQCWRHLLYV